MKPKLTLLISVLVVSPVFLGFSQEQAKEKKNKTGLYWGTGITYDWGNSSNSYSRNRYENLAELGVHYSVDIAKSKFTLKYEYTQRYMGSHLKMGDGIPGLVNQINQGVNVKFGKNFLHSEEFHFLFLMGPGVYTLHQKRIPDPVFSNQKTINDGFAPYWGMTLEFEVSGSIPLQRARMGVSTRIFVQPPFAFAADATVPQYFHQSLSLA